jgi:four helix bundle protein
MSVRRYKDLVCWQLANELKINVYWLLERTPARTDLDFSRQLKNAASSGPANIAEAFGYYRHRESARFARVARASLLETDHHLDDGIDRRHWTHEDVAPLKVLADRAIGATTRWLHYLMTTDTP